ncbi:STAS domain-containing protein [Planosporangium thailandense]|uniref:Anti-sigma factor antagonist n=1 Tax=Planosporangium thailandense TaxID=765197 RepID=A0ABX0Y336_9ACTN|nr:STAS domain-containing protein [Planosporangium thailandense]NJC71749.1 STAS domain-containing protein [Planosporangium thailandense]
MELGIATVDDTDPAITALTGELDIASAPKLEDHLRDLIDAGCTRLIVDLSDLSFCDSTGIGTLVRANNERLSRGGYLRLAAPNRHVARVLAVVGLLDAFPTYRSVDAARHADVAGLVVVRL